MKDTMFLPPASLRPRIAPTEPCTDFGWPCDGPEHEDDARRRPRSDRAAHGRRRRSRGPLQHRRRPGDLLPDAARRRRYNGARASSRRSRSRKMTHAGQRSRRAERARPRLGYRLLLLVESRRAAAARLVRSHRIHRARRSGSIRRREMFVVFLSNRVHPDGKGDVTPLRARVATIVASAITDVPPEAARARPDDRARLRRDRSRAGAACRGRRS